MSGAESHLLERFLFLIPMILSLSVHEWAHAYSAFRLGDDTAARLGRLTLNPVAHIDLIGTILLPMLGVPFGWAKPVPINPARFRRNVNMRTGMMITAAAGPVSNVLIALACIVLLSLLIKIDPAILVGEGKAMMSLLYGAVSLNVILAVFNMLPIFPLDGSRVVDGLISRRLRPAWERFVRYSPLVLILVLLSPRVLGFHIVEWPYEMVMRFLLGLSDLIIGL
jgi:Zn-dependent protease